MYRIREKFDFGVFSKIVLIVALGALLLTFEMECNPSGLHAKTKFLRSFNDYKTNVRRSFMDVWTVILFIITLLIMLVGLAGVILPVIPGVPIIWVGAFLYGLFTSFEEINWNILGIFAVLTGFTIVLDYAANLYGAKRMGATRWGILGALLGMLVGLLTGGLIGLLIGSFVGAVVGEILAGKSGSRALKAGVGTFLGFLGGTLIKFIVGCVMIGIFLWKVLF